MFEIKKYTEHITLCIFCYFYNPPNIRNPLIYCVNRYCLRSASVCAKRTSTGCSAPHIWRVPSSKALSCKHEQLFDLLTLVSLLYQNCFPNSIFFHCKKKPPKNGSFRSSGGLIIFYKGGRQPDGPEPLPRFPDVCPDIPVYIAYNVQRRDSLSED